MLSLVLILANVRRLLNVLIVGSKLVMARNCQKIILQTFFLYISYSIFVSMVNGTLGWLLGGNADMTHFQHRLYLF